MTYSKLDVRPLAGALGAEIYGADLKNLSDETQWLEIHRAFLEYHVIAIRGQKLSPADMMAVGQHFGEPANYPFARNMDGFPHITQVVKEVDEVENFGGEWHSDTTYLAKPPSTTILYSVETPPKGGETLYANTCAAYDALSDGMKKLLDDKVGVNNSEQKRKRSGPRAARYAAGIGGVMVPSANPDFFEAKHPVVRTHPETGRKALYLSALQTVRFEGMTASESEPIILWLHQHCIQPEFVCRIRWEPGQLTIWDNRCTMHYAINDYNGYRRVMRRLIVNPETPA